MKLSKISRIFSVRALDVAYLLIFILSIFYIVLNNSYTYFWYDEWYSIALIKYSYSDIWVHSSQDVHPPLYYFLLKTYTSLTGTSVLNMRFFSAIPIFLTLIVGFVFVRKIWNDKVAIFFMITFLITPATLFMASEIRMYSWCFLFVLMATIYSFLLFRSQTVKNAVLFSLFSLAAAYTHYYGLLSIFSIYLMGFFYCLCFRRYKLLHYLILVACFVIAYSPWLYHLFSQVKEVSSDYWIQGDIAAGVIEYFFPVGAFRSLGISFLDSRKIEILIPILFFIYTGVCFLKVRSKKSAVEVFVLAIVFLFPIVFGLVYSFIFRPVFHPRYACASLGVYFLCFSVLLSKIDFSKKINIGIVTSFFFIFFIMFLAAFWSKKDHLARRSVEYDNIESYINTSENKADVVILYKENIKEPFPVLFPYLRHVRLVQDSIESSMKNQSAAHKTLNGANSHQTISSLDGIIQDEQVQTVFVTYQMTDEEFFELPGKFTMVDYREIRGIPIYKLKRK